MNLHSSIFVIFFDQSQIKLPRNILSWYYLKSWDCLLTYWHPMKRILSRKKRVFNATNSNAIMQKSQNFLRVFSCISRIYIKFWIVWSKRWSSEVICFRNYWLQKAGLLKCLKNPVSEQLWAVNMLKPPKHCLNLHGSIFVRLFDPSERKSRRKILS